MFSKVKKFILNPQIRFGYLNKLGLYHHLSDEEFLKRAFKVNLGYELNLESPKSFNEKLQWLKLYNRKPEYTMMVDKYLVKDYVANLIGEEYVIPTIGVWDSPDEIDFETLPEKFVLKCNHNSGTGMCICKDKSKLNIELAKKELKKGLKENYYLKCREWPYKDVPRKIIAEQFLEESSTQSNDKSVAQLTDYKFYCFNGEPKFCQVISDRDSEEKIDFYDMDWKHQNFTGLHVPGNPYPFNRQRIVCPKTFCKMKEFAHILSYNIPFVRIDFYEANEMLYFGEITFYPASGFGVFEPDEWNYIMGDWMF